MHPVIPSTYVCASILRLWADSKGGGRRRGEPAGGAGQHPGAGQARRAVPPGGRGRRRLGLPARPGGAPPGGEGGVGRRHGERQPGHERRQAGLLRGKRADGGLYLLQWRVGTKLFEILHFFQNEALTELYEYHWRLGFRYLPATLSVPRSVGLVISNFFSYHLD